MPIISSLNNTSAGSIALPDGTYIQEIIQQEISGNVPAGGVQYGSAQGGSDIVQSFSLSANDTERVVIAGWAAPSAVYFDIPAGWNGANINIYIVVGSLS